MSEYSGPYDVVRVVDGDTVILNINGEEKRCRFIGIDTPESVHPDAERNTEEGKAASDYTKELLSGQQVYLEYDLAPQDQYGRELVYLYLPDGQMIQEILLKNLFTSSFRPTVWPHTERSRQRTMNNCST